MRIFYENFPFFCVFLALLSGILTTLIRDGKKARAVTLAMLLCAAVLNGAVFLETSLRNVNFTYAMGAFPAPWGNELRAGPVESMLCTVFCLVMLFSLMGGGKDLEEDILPEKQNLYYIMMDLLAASLFALSYTYLYPQPWYESEWFFTYGGWIEKRKWNFFWIRRKDCLVSS